MSQYYDRQGNPMTMQEWTGSYRKENHRVAEAVLPTGRWVSTVWLGLDHRFGDGPPLIFETMVFPCDADGKVTDWGELDGERYSTEAEALEGHARMVEKWSAPEPVDVIEFKQ